MKVINIILIKNFAKKHNQARSPLDAWTKVVEQASWQHLMDVKLNYPSVDGGLKGFYTVFNMKGNSFRLVTIITFPVQTVAITNVFTPAEYDQWSKSQ